MMSQRLDWARVSREFLALEVPSGPVREIIERLADASPWDLDRAIPTDPDIQDRTTATGFLIAAIHCALEDHQLTDGEIREIRHLTRVFRLEEGDTLRYQGEAVARLLALEFARILEDRTVDAHEALHKVKLQELLGLSYDDFVDAASPAVKALLLELLEQTRPGSSGALAQESLSEFRRRVMLLDTIHDMNPRASPGGYLYLLTNETMPGIVKVGMTTRDPRTRAEELGNPTGVPVPFTLLYHCAVSDPAAAEAWVHRRLETGESRVNTRREFFRASTTEVITLMVEASQVYPAERP